MTDKDRFELLVEKLEQVANWLVRLAEQSEIQSATTQFVTIREACEHDAKNFRATAQDIRTTVDKVLA